MELSGNYSEEASGEICITSFVASRHPTESCGANGLPLTPNSIAILGNSQTLKKFRHRKLCRFLDCLRGKHERVVLVSEYFPDSADLSSLKSAKSVLEGLFYLNQRGIYHGNLKPSNIRFDSKSLEVKLFDYGLSFITDYGARVAFPIGDPRLVAPEVLRAGPVEYSPFEIENHSEDEDMINSVPPPYMPRFTPNVDVWTLGMIVAAHSLDLPKGVLWSSSKNVSQIIRKVLSFSSFEGSVLERIARENDATQKLKELSQSMRAFLEACLVPDPLKRPSPEEILTSNLFIVKIERWVGKSAFPMTDLRCRNLILPPENLSSEQDSKTNEEMALDVLDINEVYYLWRLAGGDIFSELRKYGLMVTIPPVLTLPKIVFGEGHAEGAPKERCSLYDPTVITLNLNQLMSCLSELGPEDFYILLKDIENRRTANGDCQTTQNLPLIIKEKDVRYQFSRIILFRRLLTGWPFTNSLLRQEAHVDSLPLYRAEIWAALLNIDYDVLERYKEIDKETWTSTDRQIEVDIPRCHQYNNLLASPEGHRKFKRILKAWVSTNPQYVYWQGLDSLCAPFLCLNFNDEALAFACLAAFIPKYLYGMFRKDNADVIQEYLAKFSHIQAFHDSVLFNHLVGIGFIPDLYAIPWILTMFAHVFPLHDIFHLWDKLLLWNSSFPLCVGLAILFQLRQRLLQAEFNDCILLFSDLPAVDIEKCVKDSIKIFTNTPSSLTVRKYDTPFEEALEKKPCTFIARKGEEDLQLTSLTLEEIKAENLPRLSGEELLSLLTSSPNRVLLIDTRPLDDYKLGSLPEALSLPATSSFDEKNNLISNRETEKLIKKRSHYDVYCVFGSRKNMKEPIDFSQKLLELNFDRLCVLHLGIEVFKSRNIIVVPNT